jgi:hypothetical protein
MNNYLIGGAYALLAIALGFVVWSAMQTVLFFAMLDVLVSK